MGLIYMLNASPTAIDFDVYQPRKPKASAYYRCVEDHFEQLETVWIPAPLPARRPTGRRVEPTPRRENLARGTCPQEDYSSLSVLSLKKT